MIVHARVSTEGKILVRADAAHDALDTLIALSDAQVGYIVKWNPRKSNVLEWRDRVFAQGEVITPRPGKKVGTLIVNETRKIKTMQDKPVLDL